MGSRGTLTCLVLFAVMGGFAASCGDDDVTTSGIDEFQALIEQFQLVPLPLSAPYPADNPFNAERIALGRLLFFDPILGGESAPWVKAAAGKDPYRFRGNDMACGTCHHPTLAFADGRRLGAGVEAPSSMVWTWARIAWFPRLPWSAEKM